MKVLLSYQGGRAKIMDTAIIEYMDGTTVMVDWDDNEAAEVENNDPWPPTYRGREVKSIMDARFFYNEEDYE